MRPPRIGVFDSGVGGLTVLSRLVASLPFADYHYFGDTARVPYGSRADDTIVGYSRQGLNYLLSLGAELLVVACNTSSAIALPALVNTFNVPVIGVVDDGVLVAADHARKGVLVLGTRATIGSGIYQRGLALHRPGLAVRGIACPLFVPIVEEGLVASSLADEAVRHYLRLSDDFAYDSVLLGCTHFPIIGPVIRRWVGDGVQILDPSDRVAQRVRSLLPSGTPYDACRRPEVHFHVTDASDSFKAVAAIMGFADVTGVTHVDLSALDD